jgi:hypothetical protein
MAESGLRGGGATERPPYPAPRIRDYDKPIFEESMGSPERRTRAAGLPPPGLPAFEKELNDASQR